MKLATVFGACSGIRRTVNVPCEVTNVAVLTCGPPIPIWLKGTSTQHCTASLFSGTQYHKFPHTGRMVQSHPSPETEQRYEIGVMLYCLARRAVEGSTRIGVQMRSP